LSIVISVAADLIGYQEKLLIVRKFQKNLRFQVFPARILRKSPIVSGAVKIIF